MGSDRSNVVKMQKETNESFEFFFALYRTAYNSLYSTFYFIYY